MFNKEECKELKFLVEKQMETVSVFKKSDPKLILYYELLLGIKYKLEQ